MRELQKHQRHTHVQSQNLIVTSEDQVSIRFWMVLCSTLVGTWLHWNLSTQGKGCTDTQSKCLTFVNTKTCPVCSSLFFPVATGVWPQRLRYPFPCCSWGFIACQRTGTSEWSGGRGGVAQCCGMPALVHVCQSGMVFYLVEGVSVSGM